MKLLGIVLVFLSFVFCGIAAYIIFTRLFFHRRLGPAETPSKELREDL